MTNEMTNTRKPASPGKRRILVVANETLEGRALCDVIRLSTDGWAPAEVLVIAQREGRPHWLTRNLVGRARRRFAQPVLQVGIGPNEDSELVSESTTSGETH